MTQDPSEFLKMWTDLMFKTMQAGASAPTDGAPSDAFRHVRNGIFEAMGKTWEEYMRSPQFLDQMKQSLDNAITARKTFNEFMDRMNHATQNAGKEDIDSVIAALRRLETHIDRRLDDIQAKVDALNTRLDTLEKPPRRPAKKTAKKTAKKATKK